MAFCFELGRRINPQSCLCNIITAVNLFRFHIWRTISAHRYFLMLLLMLLQNIVNTTVGMDAASLLKKQRCSSMTQLQGSTKSSESMKKPQQLNSNYSKATVCLSALDIF